VNAVTRGIRRRLIEAKGVKPIKVTFLPNGVDTEFYRPLSVDESLKTRLGLAGKKIILYAGTHGYAHGLEHILDAAAMLKDEDIHFLFVGDGSEKSRLIRRVLELQLKNVTFSDPVPSSQMPSLLSISECGLVPQRKLPLFEGNRPAKTFSIMSCAKPVVFSGEGEGAQLVLDARAGYVVAPEDPAALVGAIRLIAGNPCLAREFGRNGREYVRANLTWEALVRDWLEQLRVSSELATVAPCQKGTAPERANIDVL
ncbi:MAG: glycosyltransferase family 4 protein, partial [Candidatus Acidiferrum sp.]